MDIEETSTSNEDEPASVDEFIETLVEHQTAFERRLLGMVASGSSPDRADHGMWTGQ